MSRRPRPNSGSQDEPDTPSRRSDRRFNTTQSKSAKPAPTPSPAPEPVAPPPGDDDELAPDTDDALIADGDESAPPAADTETAGEGPQRRRILVRRDLKTRIDVYLQNRLKGISRSRIQKLIDSGGVTINDVTPKHATQIRPGDVIDVILPPQGVRKIEPEPIPLDVLYEDNHFIVVNKQAGLIVHPARSNLSGTLLNGLAHRMRQRVESAGGTFQAYQTRGFAKNAPRQAGDPIPPREGATVAGLSTVGTQEFRPGIIHRLDKNTTGVIVIGKSDEAHWGIARQFEDRSTLKAYLAVVHGNLELIGGAIDQPIGKHHTIREAMAVRNDTFGKRAVTLYRVREQYQGYTLVELELKTGRTHQIRVHMAYLGHPIVGDVLYGGQPVGAAELDAPPVPAARAFLPFAREKVEGQEIEARAKLRPDLLLAHPALHAALLRFMHPITRETMTFTAPIHEPMRTLIQELRKRPSTKPVATEGWWVELKKAMCEE